VKKTILPTYTYACKHPSKYERECCAHCHKEYLTDNLLQVGKITILWLCIRCYNIEEKRRLQWNKAA